MTDLARVFADLVRYETRLYNAVDDRLRAEHGLGAGQFEFLGLIGSRGDCRVADLASGFAITTGAASKGVDRLEAAGWVRRAAHPTNRRSSVLHLTDTGRTLLDAATPSFEDVLAQWLGQPLPARSLAGVATALERLRTTVEDAGVGSPIG